jgi:ferredoxin
VKPGSRLRVDPIACDGRGLCAEVLPELITLDDWGYPIISDRELAGRLYTEAGEAVRICPKLALHIEGPGGSDESPAQWAQMALVADGQAEQHR